MTDIYDFIWITTERPGCIFCDQETGKMLRVRRRDHEENYNYICYSCADLIHRKVIQIENA